MPGRIDQQIEAFFAATNESLGSFHPALKTALLQNYFKVSHGRTKEWESVVNALPASTSAASVLNSDTVTVGDQNDANDEVKETLMGLHPWRKGPFNICGIHVDTEWRSDWKWQRLCSAIRPLAGQDVLDIGCGNGYHLFRMLGDGAKLALGIDPTRLFLYQFEAVRSFVPECNAYLLPLRSEALPAFGHFDTVFSMGVLYHRRSPIDHLAELMSFLKPGGQLVLETLVIEGATDQLLIPKDRYAKMANVWNLPSTGLLTRMLERVGFREVSLIDVNQTSTDEQRSTAWMTFQSLPDFLDPNDKNLTVEGLPAPRRAILVATRP